MIPFGFDEWIKQQMQQQAQPAPAPAPQADPMQQMQALNPADYGIPALPAMPARRQPGDLQPYVQQEQAAAQRNAQAQALVAQEQARKMIPAQAMMQQGFDANAQSMQSNNQALDEQMAQINARSQQLREEMKQNAAQSVDPGRFFRNSSTWQKIAMGVALAVSGALNPRGPNVALGAIERAIERDIDVQKDLLDRRSKNLSMEAQMLQQDKQGAIDVYKLQEYKRAQAWELVGQRFKFEAERTTDEEARKRAIAGATEADLKAATAAREAAEKMASLENARRIAGIQAGATVKSAQIAQEGATGREIIKTPQRMLETAMRYKLAQDKNELTIGDKKFTVYHKGQPIGTTDDKVTYRQAREYTYKTATALEQIDDLINTTLPLMKRRPNLFGSGSAEYKQLTAEWAALTAYTKGADMLDLGKRMEGMENDLLKGAAGEGVDTWFTKDPEDTLRGLRKQILLKSKNYYGSLPGWKNPFEEGEGGSGGGAADPFGQLQDVRGTEDD